MVPPEFVGNVMGRDVAGFLAADAVVMGQTSAGLRAAQAGDVMQLVAGWGGIVNIPHRGRAAGREHRWQRSCSCRRQRLIDSASPN